MHDIEEMTVGSGRMLKEDNSVVNLVDLLEEILSAVGGSSTEEVETLLTTISNKDFATQTTLAAILAKLIAAPATEAKQTSIISALGVGSLAGAAVATVTTAGTRVHLPACPCREVTLIAGKDNTGSIYVGGVDVSASVFGAELEKKDSVTIPVNNLNLLYIDSSENGEGISYIAVL